MSKTPNLPGGLTAVTVANFFDDLWFLITSVMLTSPTPSPYVKQKVSPGLMYFSILFNLPPV